MDNETVTQKVTSTDYWKALSHPLRCGILSLLANREMTNEEMANALGVDSGALQLHTTHLLTAQMIQLAGTRTKGSINEKLYRASSNEIFPPKPDTANDLPPHYDVLASALELYRTTWEEERADLERLQMGYQVVVFVPRSTVLDVVNQLREIMDRLMEENGTDQAGEPIALSTLIHSVSPTAFGRRRRKTRGN